MHDLEQNTPYKRNKYNPGSWNPSLLYSALLAIAGLAGVLVNSILCTV